ncbi:MAG: hypothetical protein Hens3KO_03850 [Henriciella sp.]|jgi:hypothetical protein
MKKITMKKITNAACIYLSVALIPFGSIFTASAEGSEIHGAWANGASVDACQTEAITYFGSDGSVLILSNADGEIHSFGTWELGDGTLEMTHNHFPLKATGEAPPPGIYSIVEQTADRLVVTYAQGRYKNEQEPALNFERVKCPDLLLRESEAEHDH